MIRGIIYILIFAVGFAAGGLFPGFSAQYHQRLQAQFDQVSIDLAPFQEIANRYHGGSMEALVEHHLNSTDPTFHAEGAAISMMLNNQARLAESKATAEATYVEQAVWLARNRDEQVVNATLRSFEPVFVTSENAVTFSLAIGLLVLVSSWLIGAALLAALRRLLSVKRTHPA